MQMHNLAYSASPPRAHEIGVVFRKGESCKQAVPLRQRSHNRALLPHAIVRWDCLRLQNQGLSCASMRHTLGNGIELRHRRQQCGHSTQLLMAASEK